jgi:hypothetical protein
LPKSKSTGKTALSANAIKADCELPAFNQKQHWQNKAQNQILPVHVVTAH